MPWPKKTDGTYLNFKEPGTITVTLLEPEPFEIRAQHYDGKKYVDCTGMDCRYCGQGLKSTLKCKMKVLDLKDNLEKILEGSGSLFNTLKKVIDMSNGGVGSSYMIQAEGMKLDRRYMVIPIQTTVPNDAKAITTTAGDAQDDEDPFSKP